MSEWTAEQVNGLFIHGVTEWLSERVNGERLSEWMTEKMNWFKGRFGGWCMSYEVPSWTFDIKLRSSRSVKTKGQYLELDIVSRGGGEMNRNPFGIFLKSQVGGIHLWARLVFGRVLAVIGCFCRDLVQTGEWFMTASVIEPGKPDYETSPVSLPHSRGFSLD